LKTSSNRQIKIEEKISNKDNENSFLSKKRKRSQNEVNKLILIS